MGFLAALPAILSAAGPALLGGAGGAANTRPPSLSPQQTGTLNGLLASLMANYQSQSPLQQPTPTIDPVQQSLMYNQIAQNQTGGMNAATHALASRGLGHSGILGDALTQVANQGQQSRNAADLGLQQQAVQLGQQNKQFGLQQQGMDLQSLLGLLNVQNVPGQSSGSGFLNGMAPLLAYGIQSGLNRKAAASPVYTGQSGGTGGSTMNQDGTFSYG